MISTPFDVSPVRSKDTTRKSVAVADDQPPLMVYNRSENRVDEFKTYASECQVEEGHYTVAKDLKVIGEK